MKYRRSRDESRERFFLNLEIHGKIRIFIRNLGFEIRYCERSEPIVPLRREGVGV